MRKSCTFCCVLLFCCASQAEAPQAVSPANEPAAKGPQLRLAVEVTDTSGNPVKGLQESAFTVLDNGRPVPLDFFYAHESASDETGSESVVLVIDAINVFFNLLSAERTQIEQFLRSNQGHLPAPLSIAAVSENSFTWIAEPSADGNKLADQLHQWQPHLQPRPTQSDADMQERWQESVFGLSKILNHESDQFGRKLLVYVSPGWPLIRSTDVQATDGLLHQWMDLIVSTSTNLRQQQMTIDAVEPQGSAGLDWGLIWRANLKPVKKWDHAEPADVVLQVLAVQSGGQVMHSNNDIADEIAQCMRDATSWYTVVVPQQPDKPNTWHDLQVRVNQPGAVVRAANGYYAQPQP
ncbi:MAG TPA: VWA domain-containing protein [Acidobacteriaceae bacterium]|jgi:VWFA-related protein|nr:VWA domain-containing protein [Acidobacteriaceae bacterium]